jgi:RNase P subunit RPR2
MNNVVVPADIRTPNAEPDRRYWSCPNCHRNLGEIVGVRLVILVKRDQVITFPLVTDLHITCLRCGTVSALIESAALKPTSAG